MSDDSWLEQAQAALHLNDKAEARLHLVQRLKQNAHDELAWLLLAKAVEHKEETLFCLDQVLKLNPDNSAARKGWEILRTKRVSQVAAAAPYLPAAPGANLDQKAGALSTTAVVPVTLPWRQQKEPDRIKPPRRARNWPLMIGLVLIAFIAVIALIGPSVAPRDPLEENMIIQINGKWYVPPFPLFLEGFPFGSDNFGRDMYSRVLWAVRPTMIMVFLVASIRLIVGTMIGLLSGWLTGRSARLLETLIQGALAIPVLLVSLGIIAVAVDWGVWAFVLGLALTGWVETAVQVREQTHIVKGQVYIEAAHALGASSRQLLFGHVLRQILPMMVMLFAFEASSTLMVTAGLGFLGYYIGGDSWVVVGDFVARRISGMPELGQMLATSWTTLTKPWVMVVTGSTIFIAVLGFNLAGEGLRQGMSLDTFRRRGLIGDLEERANLWLEQNLWHPLAVFGRKPAVRLALLALLALPLVGAGGLGVKRWLAARPMQPAAALQPSAPVQAAETPAQPQSLAADKNASSTPAVVYQPAFAWKFEAKAGFSGGPVLAPVGEALYVLARDGMLYALNRTDGALLWQRQLPARSVGEPALDEAGNIYVSDVGAGVSAYDPQGQLLWHFQSEAAAKSASGPGVGRSGIYYTVTNSSFGWLQAVTLDGQPRWASQAKTASFYRTPVLSNSENYLFLKDDLFDAASGQLLPVESPVKVVRYFPGDDGLSYLVAGHTIIQWALNGQVLEIISSIEPVTEVNQVIVPLEAGVLPDGTTWKLYSSPGAETSLSWVKVDGTVVGEAVIDFSSGKLVGMRPDLTTYVCGGRPFEDVQAECAALQPGQEKPLWQLDLGDTGLVVGGSWHAGRLYVTTSGGLLAAITEKELGPVAAAPQPPQPPAPLTAGAPGVQWSYAIQGVVQIGPLLGPDDSIYLVDQDQNLIVLAADGTLISKLKLPTALFVIKDSFGAADPIWPLILPDGSVVVVSDQQAVYALDLQGKVRWEAPLEKEPRSFIYEAEDGSFYIFDRSAGIYAFDENGPRWNFRSQAAKIPTNSLAVGPDGVVYYGVTNRSKGFVQAVSPQGQGLWVVTAKTQSFYDSLEITPDGSILALHEDLIDTRRGQLLALELPERVDQWIMGEDGHTYVRMGHNVKEWQLGSQGFEILSSTEWGAESGDNLPPEQAFVDTQRVIWLFYRRQIVWVSLDGKVLGTQPIDASGAGRLIQYNFTDSRYSICRQFPKEDILECQVYQPGVKEPLLNARVPQAPFFNEAFIDGGYAYLLTENRQTLVKVFLGSLESK